MAIYRPTSDWIFYFLCGLFALLTSLMPIMGGRYWMMLGMQGMGLWAFTAMASRFGPAGRHVTVFLLWIGTQIGFLMLLGIWNMGLLERLLPQGFELRRMWLALYHAETAARPLAVSGWTLLAGGALLATAGSLVTGGLTGSWLVAHSANYVAYFLAGLGTDIGWAEASGWMHFAQVAIPVGQVVLLAGLWTTHLGLSPWLWQHRLCPAMAWPLQKPVLGLGLATTAAGVLVALL